MPAARILIYGKDPSLLNSRRLLLEHAGNRVTATTEFQVVKELLTSCSFEVFVLCHSLSARDRESALAASRLVDVPPLNLILNTAFSHYFGSTEDSVTEFCDPKTFVSTVSKLYGRYLPDQRE